jgi:hypothetical protein
LQRAGRRRTAAHPGIRRCGARRAAAAGETEATMSANLAVALITAVTIMTVVVWFDRRCLVDLSQTNDRDLRYFNRNTWALIIVLSFPVGPVLYLLYGRGPGRYR